MKMLIITPHSLPQIQPHWKTLSATITRIWMKWAYGLRHGLWEIRALYVHWAVVPHSLNSKPKLSLLAVARDYHRDAITYFPHHLHDWLNATAAPTTQCEFHRNRVAICEVNVRCSEINFQRISNFSAVCVCVCGGGLCFGCNIRNMSVYRLTCFRWFYYSICVLLKLCMSFAWLEWATMKLTWNEFAKLHNHLCALHSGSFRSMSSFSLFFFSLSLLSHCFLFRLTKWTEIVYFKWHSSDRIDEAVKRKRDTASHTHTQFNGIHNFIYWKEFSWQSSVRASSIYNIDAHSTYYSNVSCIYM